jgi:GNAT superfamily N-acetyltransferase
VTTDSTTSATKVKAASKSEFAFAGMVRAPREQDYASLADLAGELSYPSTVEEIVQRLNGLNASSDHVVFVAELPGGEIAGWIAVSIYRGLEMNPRGEVTGLVVGEKFRSQQVGKHLLARAEEWTRAQGCSEISLRSNIIRDRAHAFYLREGYQHTKTQKTFRKKLAE